MSNPNDLSDLSLSELFQLADKIGNKYLTKEQNKMTHPKNDIANVGFPESQLIWRTSEDRCAELSAAWYNGTLHTMPVEPELKQVCEDLCKVRGYKAKQVVK